MALSTAYGETPWSGGEAAALLGTSIPRAKLILEDLDAWIVETLARPYALRGATAHRTRTGIAAHVERLAALLAADRDGSVRAHIEQLAKLANDRASTERMERILEVESLDVLEDEMVPPAARETARFWESLSLDELAEQQCVAAVSDLDEISALWPVDDDPDELLQHILHEREARSKLADGGNAA